MSRVQDILASVREVPPWPGMVLKLINVLNDPGATVNDIVETIRYDAAVTSQMLRFCNSAYFGLSREVNSINDAIRYLGTVKVLQLVMAVHSSALLSQRQAGYGLEPGVLWRHSVGVALASSVFAERVALLNANLAFTAGLLHDIGKVVLNRYLAEAFADVAHRVTEQRISFSEAERQVLGLAHDEIGATLAERWQLPESIVRCIRYHHNPTQLSPPDALVDVVYLADCVCMLMGIGLGTDGLSYRADEAVMQRHNLHEVDLEVAGAQTTIELKRVEGLFADAFEAGAVAQPATS